MIRSYEHMLFVQDYVSDSKRSRQTTLISFMQKYMKF
jgi:hypothetical protein